MQEFFSKFDGGQFIGLVSSVGGLLVAAIAILSYQWRRVRQTEIEAALKQQMLERGMSAEDIERVLRPAKGRKYQESVSNWC